VRNLCLMWSTLIDQIREEFSVSMAVYVSCASYSGLLWHIKNMWRVSKKILDKCHPPVCILLRSDPQGSNVSTHITYSLSCSCFARENNIKVHSSIVQTHSIMWENGLISGSLSTIISDLQAKMEPFKKITCWWYIFLLSNSKSPLKTEWINKW